MHQRIRRLGRSGLHAQRMFQCKTWPLHHGSCLVRCLWKELRWQSRDPARSRRPPWASTSRPPRAPLGSIDDLTAEIRAALLERKGNLGFYLAFCEEYEKANWQRIAASNDVGVAVAAVIDDKAGGGALGRQRDRMRQSPGPGARSASPRPGT